MEKSALALQVAAQKRAAEAEAKVALERQVGEASKREAALQVQVQSAEEARRRAEAERKRIDGEQKRAVATNAEKPSINRPTANVALAAAANSSATVAATAASSKGNFDGTYEGQMCNFPNNPDRRSCWAVVLRVRNGAADIEWPNRLVGKEAHAHITIAPNGGVSCALDGYARDGTTFPGAMVGHLADNHIDARGRWNNGVVVDGHWTRAQ